MRLDKYLKVSRLVKRRTVAKVLADNEKFIINGRVAKPSSDVKINDVVELFLGRHHIVVKVLLVCNNATISKSQEMFEIIKDEIIKEEVEND